MLLAVLPQQQRPRAAALPPRALLATHAAWSQESTGSHHASPAPRSCTGTVVRPRYIEDEREFGALSVHTVVLFTGTGSWGQATWLRLQLEGNASQLFDAATFGAVYVRAVSAPYLVRTLHCRGCASQ